MEGLPRHGANAKIEAGQLPLSDLLELLGVGGVPVGPSARKGPLGESKRYLVARCKDLPDSVSEQRSRLRLPGGLRYP